MTVRTHKQFGQTIWTNRLFFISVTWLKILGVEGVKSAISIIVKSKGQFRKRGKIGLNQSLIHMHLFPHCHPKFLYLPFFNSVPKKNIISSTKYVGGICTPCFPPPPDLNLCSLYLISCFSELHNFPSNHRVCL